MSFLRICRTLHSRTHKFGPQRSEFLGLSKEVYSRIFLHNNLRRRISIFSRARQKQSSEKISDVVKKVKVSDLRRILRLAKPVRYRLLAAIGLLSISSAVSISVPYFMGRIMDSIFSGDNLSGERTEENSSFFSKLTPSFTHKKDTNVSEVENNESILSKTSSFFVTESSKDEEKKNLEIMTKLGQFCLTLTGIFAIGALANFGRVYLMITAGQKVVNRLRTQTYSSIIKQDMGFFDKSKTGELVNRLSNDVTVVGHSVTMNISDGLRALASAAGGTTMMVIVSPKLSIVGLSIVPPVAICAIVYGRYVRQIVKKLNDALAEATNVASERISNIRTVRSFAAEQKEAALYAERIDRIMTQARKDAVARALFFGLTGLSGNLIMLSILYAGGHLVTAGALTIGQLSSFLLYAVYVGVSIGGMSGFYSELMRGLGASSRVFELIERKPSIPLSGGLQLSSLKGEIVLSGVHFTYPGREDAAILKGVNLTLPQGKVTAVVGPSGSGKSTISALLLRFYDPDRGTLTLDGVDVKEIDPKWLRKHIGSVSQDPVLFSSSIRENITYGADNPESVSLEDVTRAAEEANAYQFIQSFPEGFDTVVGERGLMLSGGQRQRIAIARALINNPRILIMDEATSALDAESEYQVQWALEKILREGNRTILIIAHRLSTIKNADQIAVLAEGEVKELGSFSELMKIENGIFKQLVQKQTTGFR